MQIVIRNLEQRELIAFEEAMSVLPWNRDGTLYTKYLEEHAGGAREFVVATYDHQYAGHVSLIWHSKYEEFKENAIPEISDLLVLPGFQRKGIGKKLIQHCEKVTSIKNSRIGLAVGLYHDYAPAQRLYTRMGYKLFCHGATSHYKSIQPGKKVLVDDDLVIWLIKDLNK